MRTQLLAGDWDAVGTTLANAFPNRKRLSPNITTPQMDQIIETALANGAIAAKVCGAGGGGCIAFYCERGRRGDVEQALSAHDGAKVLDWSVQTGGLTVNVSGSSTAAI